MAITESELQISNSSYTNKDFASIYEELLTYAKKISSRYDPTKANESDAILMLFKLLAFVGDKVSYNVDKNILEQFISSCTQESSMYDLTSRLGYNMHYYKAATTDVTLSYNFSSDSTATITIPQYTSIQNSDKTINFITLNQVILNQSTPSNTTTVMQGLLNTLTILDNTTITLNNLDTQNRLYFPEKYVAQNGVFITGGAVEDNWECVDNLNLATYGTPVFVFRYDSKQALPYIEFPEWITTIIGEGLTIKYLTTTGEEGNVKSKELTIVDSINSTDSSITVDNITVTNTNAATNGQNAETINEAYQGFKKTIGTFENLVTCRDYANYIYNNMSNVISNIVVADRRTDINYSSDVISYDITGVVHKTINETTTTNNKDITPFNLCVYPLKNTSSSFTYKDSYKSYKDTFTPYDDNTYISSKLEQVKSIAHILKDLDNDDIYCIKNYYKIDAIISTINKVNVNEQNDILQNVNNALASTYYARNVDFGTELSYDNILSTIKGADSRIKSVSLYEPTLDTKILTKDNNELSLYSSDDYTNQFKTIIAKNLLSGRVSLFNYKDEFEVLYNHKTQAYYEKVNFTALANININASNSYTLSSNEVVQFIAPSIITEYTATYGVNYYLKLSNRDVIPANKQYKLQVNDELILEYTDSNGNQQFKNFTIYNNYYIQPNFDLYTSDYRDVETSTHSKETPTKTINSNNYYTLKTNQEINIGKLNSETLSSNWYCYWYTKHKANNKFIIKWDNNNEYLLDEGEYFFYSDTSFNNLYIFGSGTKLTLGTKLKLDSSSDWQCNIISNITDLITNGISGFTNLFVYKNFSTNNLTIQEQQIVSLSHNDVIINNTASSIKINNNSFNSFKSSDITYKIDGDTTEYTLTDGLNWQARGLLYLNIGPKLEYQLESNQTLTVDNENTIKNSYIQSSSLIQGFSNTISSITNNIYCYTKSTETFSHIGHYNSTVLHKGSNIELSPYNPYSNIDSYVFLYVNPSDNTTITCKYDNETETFTTNTIKIIKNAKNITLSSDSANLSNIVIGDVRYVDGINSNLTSENLNIEDIQNYIISNYPSAYAVWNQLNYIDESNAIDLSANYTLDNPYVFYNKNNIANPWVINEIDFDYINDNNSISIAISSTK